MNIEIKIILFLIIIIIILLYYKNIQNKSNIKSNIKPNIIPIQRSIIKNKVELDKPIISNDIITINNKEPTDDLLKMYEPAKDIIPIDILPLNHNGRLQSGQLRWNI
jgi:hypothetical protein